MSVEQKTEMITIRPDRLRQYTHDIFAAAGATDEVATRLANSLVDSNLAGHDSHGVIRISQYMREIKEGQLVPDAQPEVSRQGPSWALVDGKWGFGHEAARFSMARAIEKARESGVAAVTAVRCNHIGRVGEWAEQAAAAGMVGMATVGFGTPSSLLVAPYGGAARALSTDPIAMAAPRREGPPVLLDFATSVSPEGKVRVARDKGVQLPAGCLVDKDGNPSTDPNDLYAGGALLPVGGHKGYALAVMVEVLSMALSGANAKELHSAKGANSGSFFLAINPEVFGSRETFTDSVEQIIQRMVAVPPAPGFERVLFPGEPEAMQRQARAAGIVVPVATWRAIGADAGSVGVEVPSV